MDILGPLLRRTQGSQFVAVTTDCYTKLGKAIRTKNTNASTVVNIFLEHWFANYTIPSNLPTDDGLRFESKWFFTVSSTFEVNNFTTTEYHPQASGHVERFN